MSNSSSLLLSEGTCYFGAGQLADSHFIPCGNADLEGPQACCYENDYCLSSNTCWDPDTIVTYIAGCTDPLFRSSKCPQRNNYPDQQWVALARCDGNDQDIWTGCAYHPEKIQLEKENCDCNMTNQLIQNPNGKGSFDEIGRLPNGTGDAIDYNPTAVPTATFTSSPSTNSASNSGGGLSTGAKAGIGVGVAIAGILLIAVIGFFVIRRRRNQRQAYNEKSELGGASIYPETEKSELGSDHKYELSPERGFAEVELPAEIPASGHIPGQK